MSQLIQFNCFYSYKCSLINKICRNIIYCYLHCLKSWTKYIFKKSLRCCCKCWLFVLFMLLKIEIKGWLETLDLSICMPGNAMIDFKAMQHQTSALAFPNKVYFNWKLVWWLYWYSVFAYLEYTHPTFDSYHIKVSSAWK